MKKRTSNIFLTTLPILFGLICFAFLAASGNIATANTHPFHTVQSQAASEPNSISIPSVNLTSKFVSVGTTHNKIDTPSSSVGWWNRSAVPGTKGAVFLNGHNPGVFSDLHKLENGAIVTLVDASGKSFNYTVIHREILKLSEVNMKTVLSVQRGASQGLSIMTCMGDYNPKTRTADERLIVYAIRV